MMRSMFSAVSGLRAHQTRMDVIGNNIANVNTAGFKGSRVTFQEVFSQTIRGAGAPQGNKGGTNPQQVGLGINIASMDTFHIRGSVETTGYNTDAMINGDGFFIVADGDVRSYTRAGSFGIDEVGNLVTPDGLKVQGYMYDSANQRYESALSGLQVSKSTSFPAMATEGDGAVKFGGNLDANTVIIEDNPAAGDNISTLVDEYGESAVARDTTFTVYDEKGGEHDIRVAFIKTADNEYEVWSVDDDENLVEEVGNVEFNSDGTYDAGELTFTDLPGKSGADPFSFTVDLSKITEFANESDASAENITGFKQGSLNDFAIDANGVITGYFTNGQMRPIGRIALANFSNPAGLEKTGSNLYRTTANSGEPLIGNPGTGGRGSLNPGALEMSNVDLSREFTNMITTQRGFQANSRVITSSDEMLQEVVNMKR